MKKRIALLAAITLLAGICIVPVSASVTVTPQSDVLVRYDFEDATDSLFKATTASMLAEITPEKGNETNKVQRFYKDSNKGEGGSAKNDTMFNLPYIPEIIEISYDFNIINYGSLAKDDQIWYSTYLKVGTGNGDEENFYSRHRFPKLFAADNSQNRGLSFRVDPKGNANVTSTGRLGVSHGNWYTLITRINNTAKTSEVFAMKRGDSSSLIKLGESSGIEIKDKTFGLEMRADTQNSLKSDVYIDNIQVRDISTEKKNTFGISTLSVADGLTGVAKLTDDVTRAEVYCEGTKIADLDASVNKSFKITADAADVIKNYGTEKFELVCYNAANTEIDRVSAYKDVSANVYSVKYAKDTINGEITTESSASGDAVVQNLFTDFKPIKDITTKWSFDIAKTAEIDKMGVQFRIIGNNDSYNGKAWLPDQFLAADKSVYDNALIDSKDMELNKKYHFDIVFNPFTCLIYFDVSKDGSNIFHMEKPFIRMYTETSVPLYGINELGYVFKAKQGGQGALQITDMTFSALEEMLTPSAKSYISHSGESAAVVNGTVPTSAKSVLLNIAGYGNIDPAAVKVLKDGAEVSGASVSIAASSLKVAASFEHGRYDIVIPTGAQYLGETLTMPVHAGFNVENKFGILSPANGTVIDAQGTKIAVADDGKMTGVELSVDGKICEMTKNEAGIWEYTFVPEHTGDITVEAVANYADGTTQKDTITITVKNTLDVSNPNVGVAADTGFSALGGGKYTVNDTSKQLKYTLLQQNPNTEWNGTIKFGYDISFSDVSKFGIRFEAQHNTGWGAYPLNHKQGDMLMENGYAKDAYGNNAYQYEANKTYRFEYEYDMTNKVQNAYVTDLSTGEKFTLAENIQIQKGNGTWTAAGQTIIPDGAYLYQMQLYVKPAADATENDSFTISNGYFKRVIDLPEIVAVSYEKDGAFVPAENGMIKKTMKIKYTLSSSLLNENDMSVDYIKLYKDGEETFVDEISYSAPEITVTLSEDTEEFAEYKLVISGEVTVNSTPIGLPIVNYVRVANESGIYLGKAEINKSGTILKVSVPVDNSGSPASARLFIATYAGDKLTGVKMSAASSVTGFGKLYAELPYTGEDDVAKVFLWQSAESKTPLKTAEEISLK